jgi:hypothetical protein
MADLFSTEIQNNFRTVSGTLSPSKDDTVIYCDTSTAPVVINLLQIPTNRWNTTYKLYIVDNANNASTNNITINAGTNQTIDNLSSITIATNGASVCVRVSANAKYATIGGSTIAPSLTIPVKNTVYVMKNGNDTTGLVERFDKPFLTITAAVAAALIAFPSRSVTSRVKIVVESGLYTENINLKEFIDFDFGNSVLEGYITDNNVSFSAINDGEWHSIIYGNALIKKTIASGSYGQALILFKSANKTLIYCDTLYSTLNDTIAMLGGYCRIYCNNIQGKNITSASANAINMAANTSETVCLLEVFNAKIDTYLGGSSPTIDYARASGTSLSTQTLALFNCIVRTKIDTTGLSISLSAITCGNTSASTEGTLKLYNTTIYSQNGNSIDAVDVGLFINNVLNVYYIGNNVANVATAASGSSVINTFINTLDVDAALPY